MNNITFICISFIILLIIVAFFVISKAMKKADNKIEENKKAFEELGLEFGKRYLVKTQYREDTFVIEPVDVDSIGLNYFTWKYGYSPHIAHMRTWTDIPSLKVYQFEEIKKNS